MSATTSWQRDKLYGRRGGNWVDGSGNDIAGRPCDVCARPMVVGQKSRHATCSPPLECCGWPTDLVADLPRHLKQHAEAEL